MTRFLDAVERFRTGRARAVLWALVVALLAAPFLWREPATRELSAARRLLGPFAETAAEVQWARADHAWRRGRRAEGYALAASALELAPDAPAGWIFLARHFAFERAALEREPDVAARRLWMQAAFDVLDRGAPYADGAGALSFERGVLFSFLAELAANGDVPEAERPWPGGAPELFDSAARAYDAAASKGDPDARSAAADARARAAELRAAAR